MKVVLPKIFPYQILFAICVCVTYFNNYELTFATWFFSILLSYKKTYSITLLKYLLPFAAILIVSICTGLFYDNNRYDSIRDFTYLIKPIFGLLLGYQLCRNNKCKPFNTIVYTGLIIAIVHIGVILFNVVVHKIINMHELRGKTGFFGDFEVFALIIAMFHKKFEMNVSEKKMWIIIAILAFSSLFYLSRTNFIQFGVLFFAMKGFLKITKKTLVVFVTFISITLIGYSVIYNMHLNRNGKGVEAFLFKIKNAPIEAFKTKINKEDYEDFNDNFRSFENIMVVKQVSEEGFFGVMFGKGLGGSIDLGRRMQTNDMTYVSHEPIVHNAFMTVFLKSGLAGSFFMIYFLIIILKKRKKGNNILNQTNLLIFGSGIYLIMANWVLLGLFLKIDNKSIILGFLISFVEILNKQKNNQLIEK